MPLKTVFRLFAVPLTILTLALALAMPAAAGGGEMPTGPTALLTPPEVELNEDGTVVVTTTLVCWGDTVTPGAEASVYVGASVGQGNAAGFAAIDTHCAVDPQVLTLTIVSGSGHPFHPGSVSGMFEFTVISMSSAGSGIGEINETLLPVQAGNQ